MPSLKKERKQTTQWRDREIFFSRSWRSVGRSPARKEESLVAISTSVSGATSVMPDGFVKLSESASSGLATTSAASSRLKMGVAVIGAGLLAAGGFVWARRPTTEPLILAEFDRDFVWGIGTAPVHVEDNLDGGWLAFARDGHVKAEASPLPRRLLTAASPHRASPLPLAACHCCASLHCSCSRLPRHSPRDCSTSPPPPLTAAHRRSPSPPGGVGRPASPGGAAALLDGAGDGDRPRSRARPAGPGHFPSSACGQTLPNTARLTRP